MTKAFEAAIRNYDNEGNFGYVTSFPVPANMLDLAERGFNSVMDIFPNVLPTNCSVRGPNGRFVKWRN